MRQMLLLAGVGVLTCGLAGALCGCGSNDTPPLSVQDQEPAATASARPQVKEVLQGALTATLPQARLIERTDLDATEIEPPDKSGGRGMTVGELKALAAAALPVDPDSIEIEPPDKSGGRGKTVGELKAIPMAAPQDPFLVELSLPNAPQPGRVIMPSANVKR